MPKSRLDLFGRFDSFRSFPFVSYSCHFIFLSYCFILCRCLTFIVLDLPACKWFAPFAADV